MKQTKQHFIEKDDTNFIKGIALILMFIHHFWACPAFYAEGISYPNLLWVYKYLFAPTKICVFIFAFLTGYFYYYSKKKTFKYSVKKITDLWITYIVIFLLLLLVAIKLNVYNFDIQTLILEFFAIRRPIMVFCWYVIFYIISILILPIYFKLSENYPVFCFFISIILPPILNFSSSILFQRRLIPQEVEQTISFLTYFPCVASGLLFAKYGFFFEFKKLLNKKSKFINIIISLAIILFSSLARFFTESYDFALTPLFVYGVIEIYHNVNFKRIFFAVNIIGKYSLLMWFIHCIFFNSCKNYTQKILFFPENPVLVTLWGLLICLTAAFILKFPIDFINKFKNKRFR